MDSSGFNLIGGNLQGCPKRLFKFDFCGKWGSQLPHFLTLPKDEFSDILLDESIYLFSSLLILRSYCVRRCREEKTHYSVSFMGFRCPAADSQFPKYPQEFFFVHPAHK